MTTKPKTPSSTTTTPKEILTPVGIDIGSLNTRIALSPLHPSPPPSSSSSTTSPPHHPHHYQSPPLGRIVPNESGERYTISLSTVEPAAIPDPSNDQYWDAPASSSSQQQQNGRRKKKEERGETAEYIFGEAARRSLQREKKRVEERSIRSLLRNDDGGGGGEDDGEEEESQKRRNEERQTAIKAYLSHLITQATNATDSHPSSLRIVLSTPDETTTALPPPPSHLLQTAAHEALLSSIRQTGWETSPALLSSPPLNKRDKKTLIRKLESSSSTPRIIGTISESIAVCIAHGLFTFDEYGPSWSSPPPTSSSPAPPAEYRNILIIDWGNSALKLTHLHRPSTTTSHLSPTTTNTTTTSHHPNLSGHTLLSLLVQHVSELFARQPSVRSCGIRAGDITQSRKAREKLERVCGEALQALATGGMGKVRVAVDGLYEGLDCNVEVMRGRFEMVVDGWVSGAERVLREFAVKGEEKVDVLLVAGSVGRMPKAVGVVEKVFGGKERGVWRGRGVGEVPPEEAVAMGCAMYANTVCSGFGRVGLGLLGDDGEDGENDGVGDDGDDDDDDCGEIDFCNTGVALENVPLCPIGVGLSIQTGDSAAVILIASGTPLPASVSRMVDVSGRPDGGALGIVQVGRCLGGNGDVAGAMGKAEEEQVIGTIGGIPNGVDRIEVCMELSVQGKISMCVNGGPITTF